MPHNLGHSITRAPIVKPTSSVETPSTTTIKPGVKKKRKRKRHKLSHRYYGNSVYGVSSPGIQN